jgi:hypothetical protein
MQGSFLHRACVLVSLLMLGACVGGAGIDRQSEREAAFSYRQFRADNVSIHTPSDGSPPSSVFNRDNYFAHLENHVDVPANVETRMGETTFFTTFANGKRVIKVMRAGQVVLSETTPGVFYMGDLQAASVRIGGLEYLLLAANTRASTNRRWFGIYSAGGTRQFAASFERPIAHVRQNIDGVSLFFYYGDSMRIRFQ